MLSVMPKIMPPPGALAYDLSGAALVSGLSTSQLTRAINLGDLRAKRSSRHQDGGRDGKFIVLRDELEAYLRGLPDA